MARGSGGSSLADRSLPDRSLIDRSLLAIFAHPDDESLACGGLLARCAQAGARVSLLCLTRGEHGPGGDPHTLGETRARELHEAARVLGVHDVTMLEHEDGMLPWVDRAALEADIGAAIRRTAPDVVVTFDEDGLYGHPDHIATHERTTAVVAGLGDAAPALRYVSMPRGAMRALVTAVSAARRVTPEGVGATTIFGLDSDAFGAMAPPPTLVVDGAFFAVRKLHALRCHRTQVAGSLLEETSDDDAVRHLGVEHYRHADVGSRAPAFIDDFGAPVAAAAPR